MGGVQGKVDRKDVDGGFPEEAQDAPGGVGDDDGTHLGGIDAPGQGDAVHLELCVLR